MHRYLGATLALALAACGGTNVSQIASSTPLGTVSGLVTNTRFEPMQGVGVTLVLGEGGDGSTTFKATTNAAGGFSFKDVPAGGSGQLTVAKAGFGAARQEVWVPSSAGNFPIDDGNGNAGIFVLMDLSGTVKFNVYSASGKPAKGARGLLEVTPSAFTTTSSGTYGTGQGVISVEVAADDNGTLSFTGVPTPAEIARVNGSYQLTIGALDEDGDGTADSLGTRLTYTSSTLFTNPRQNIYLSSASTSAPLQINASNLDSLTGFSSLPFNNALKPSDPITVVFNQPIAEASRTVKVVEEDCSKNVAVTVTQRGSNVLTITPTAAWTTGAEYQVVIRATGLESGTTRDFHGYFWAIDPSVPRPLSNMATFYGKKAAGNTNTGVLQTGDELYVVFDTPVTWLGGPQARAFINFDLNGNGTIGGGDPGELNANNFNLGFTIDLAEETFDANTSTFTCSQNSYGSRYRINYSGLPMGGVPVTTTMRVTIPDDQAAASGYQTAWGLPAFGDINGSLSQIRQ